MRVGKDRRARGVEKPGLAALETRRVDWGSRLCRIPREAIFTVAWVGEVEVGGGPEWIESDDAGGSAAAGRFRWFLLNPAACHSRLIRLGAW